METLPKKYILETVEACREYTERLNSNLQTAATSLVTINETADLARSNVEVTFKLLTDQITSCLNARKQELLSTINKFEAEAEAPLIQCAKEINSIKETTDQLLKEATLVLSSGGFKSEDLYLQFMERSAKLGGLPAVPEVECVPNITFHATTNNVITDFNQAISLLGSVSKIGPVQITTIEARPGSLIIRWEDIDVESDVHTYRLQIADKISMDVTNDESRFKDIFIGSDHSYIVRDLHSKVDYTFRICCRTSDTLEWSAWSLAKTGRSDMLPYTWDRSNTSYVITDDGKVARMVQPDILYSSGPQICSGHSLQFSIANYIPNTHTEAEGIALCGHNSCVSQRQEGVIFASFNGKIYVDGRENRTHLPALRNGDRMTWDCELLKNEKWRITIEVRDKCVTYDWRPEPLVAQLYFSAVLRQSDVHILVH